MSGWRCNNVKDTCYYTYASKYRKCYTDIPFYSVAYTVVHKSYYVCSVY